MLIYVSHGWPLPVKHCTSLSLSHLLFFLATVVAPKRDSSGRPDCCESVVTAVGHLTPTLSDCRLLSSESVGNARWLHWRGRVCAWLLMITLIEHPVCLCAFVWWGAGLSWWTLKGRGGGEKGGEVEDKVKVKEPRAMNEGTNKWMCLCVCA